MSHGILGRDVLQGENNIKKVIGLAKSSLPETCVIELPVLQGFDKNHTHTDRHAAHWCQLAQCIEAEYLKHDGFVVWAELDKTPYIASALSFMLENLGKIVIFTGCQTPFAHPYADGIKNLLATVALAGTVEIPEVCIFDNNKLFRANRCRLGNSTMRPSQSAGSMVLESQDHGQQLVTMQPRITSPNMKPLARIDSYAGQFQILDRHVLLSPPKGRLRVALRMEARMVVIKMVPNFDLAPLVRLMTVGLDTCRAIVLELYGTGNAPRLEPQLIEALRMAREREVVVVVNSQCVRGTVNLQKYATAEALMRVGVVAALDMTTEATCSKLAYLLGKGLGFEQIRTAMQENLRGEITNPMTGLAYLLRARI